MSEYKPEVPMDTPKKKKERKFHPVLTIALAGLVGIGGGFTGGYLAYHSFGTNTTVVYKAADTSNPTQTSVSSNGEMTTTQIAAKAAVSVVEINVKGTTTTYGMFGGTYETASAGSGVIISEDGYVITNHHVVEDGTEYTVKLSDGTEYSAQLIGSDEKSDIAILKIDAENLTPAVIGDSDSIAVGDKTVVIGNPLGTLGGTVTDGIISAVNRDLTINNQSMTLIQTNAAINSGNSGGGMFDANGNLIGIVNAKDSGTTSSGTVIEGLGFAIPINYAMNIGEQLISYGRVTNRATLGVLVGEIGNSDPRYTSGVYITDIISGSGAEKAGLKAYDRIVSADGNDITTYSDLTAILNKKAVGDTIDLVIERNGQTQTITVTLTGALDDNA